MIYLLFVFLITIVIAYIFGFIIVYLIDNRLNKINIESFNNIETPKTNNNEKIEKTEKKEKKENDIHENNIKMKKKNSIIEGYNDNNSFKEWNIEKKKTQVCIKNHDHTKDGSYLKCTYGVTNYADPKDMSPIDYKIFNLNYPSNMTLQDYINWLYCYIDKEDQLPYNHLKNLEKMKAGIELVVEEGVLPPPAYYYPALNAKDYFDKMYNETNEFNIAGPLNSTTGPMLGYNCDEYSEFSQNLNVHGLSGQIRNTDIAIKKNAKKLRNYIVPQDSNAINIEKENEIYHVKNVEI